MPQILFTYIRVIKAPFALAFIIIESQSQSMRGEAGLSCVQYLQAHRQKFDIVCQLLLPFVLWLKVPLLAISLMLCFFVT